MAFSKCWTLFDFALWAPSGGSVWLPVDLCGSVWPVWLCVALCGSVWLCVGAKQWEETDGIVPSQPFHNASSNLSLLHESLSASLTQREAHSFKDTEMCIKLRHNHFTEFSIICERSK